MSYAAYYNLTAGNRIYHTDPVTGEVTETLRFAPPFSSRSKMSSSKLSSSPKKTKKSFSSKLAYIVDQLKPISEPLPPTRIYEPVLQRPLFGKTKPGNEVRPGDRKLWEAGKVRHERRDSLDTLVGEDEKPVEKIVEYVKAE